jgi:aryl-alcohol dehydrogenase-like predicted oxidoreductase
MRYNKLGDSGVEVSEFSLGCWPFAGGKVWGHQEDSDSISTVHAALDAGITTFDTAEGYNDEHHSEEVLGRALKGRRKEAVIATKLSGPHLAGGEVERTCEASLKRLGTDVIDLYQIHWPNHDIPVEETYRALEALVSKGKVRAVGVCNFATGDLNDLLACGPIVTDQLPYNLLWRPIEDAILPKCRENGIGIVCYSPMAQGLLTGRYKGADEVPDGLSRSRLFKSTRPLAQHTEVGAEEEVFEAIGKIRKIADGLGQPMANVALAWVRQQPGVATLLVGARNPQELSWNLPALDLTLSDDVVRELSGLTDSVKRYLGGNADMWNSENRMR